MKGGDLEKTELKIAAMLRAGVLMSAAVILLGTVLYLATGDGGYGGAFPVGLGEVFSGILLLRPWAVVMAGLFILILTPVARVALSLLIFIREKDYVYVGITAVVLAVLIVSLLLGKAE